MDSSRLPGKFAAAKAILPKLNDVDSVPASLILKTFLIAWGIYYVSSCVSSRYLHPLSRFPGPFWASISNFWKLYILSTKESHTRGIEYHKKYGMLC